MFIPDLQELIPAEAAAGAVATTDAIRALHIGRVQAFSFILAEENQARQRVECLAHEILHSNECGFVTRRKGGAA